MLFFIVNLKITLFQNTDCFKQLANELDGEFGGGLLGPKAIVPPGVANPGFDEHYDEASNGSGSKVPSVDIFIGAHVRVWSRNELLCRVL